MTRRRKVLSIYVRIARTYMTNGRGLLLLAVIVFVPLGLIDAAAVEADAGSFDLSSGLKVAALLAAVSILTATSLLGEVFYSGAVAVSLSRPRDQPAPGLREIAGRLKYGRLIALDLVYVLAVVLGMVAFVVPGVLVFVFLGLGGPIVELEGRTVRGAFARSFSLVRGSFWVVAFVLIPVEIVGDALTEALEALVHGGLGHSFFAGWAASALSNIVLAPAFAIAAVLLTLDLIAASDGRAEGADGAAAPTPSAA